MLLRWMWTCVYVCNVHNVYYYALHNLYINAAVANTCTSCNAVTLTHAVVCNPPCANGTGVCVANNTCSCAPGYFGDTCSEQGKLHSTQLILQLYMYQLGLMLHLCHVRTYKYWWVCILYALLIDTQTQLISSDFQPCEVNVCQNGGTCTQSVDLVICDCPEGFGGKQCQTGDTRSTHTVYTSHECSTISRTR